MFVWALITLIVCVTIVVLWVLEIKYWQHSAVRKFDFDTKTKEITHQHRLEMMDAEYKVEMDRKRTGKEIDLLAQMSAAAMKQQQKEGKITLEQVVNGFEYIKSEARKTLGNAE